jgi:hypothetical protein
MHDTLNCIHKEYMNIRRGIILKTYFPLKRKIVVLDQTAGKVSYVPTHEDVCVGTLIEYTVDVPRTGIAFLHNAHKIGLPLLLAQNDILFFHHVLELCYYFIPEGIPVEDVFLIVESLYVLEHSRFTTRFKKLLLMKLFVALGMYPEERAFQKPYFCRLASVSIDILVELDLDLKIERELDAWLRACITLHPHNEKFKTIRFLEESRLP